MTWSVMRLHGANAEGVGEGDGDHPGGVPGVAVAPALPVGLEERFALLTGDLEAPITGASRDALAHGTDRGARGRGQGGAVGGEAELQEFVRGEERVQVMVLDT